MLLMIILILNKEKVGKFNFHEVNLNIPHNPTPENNEMIIILTFISIVTHGY